MSAVPFACNMHALTPDERAEHGGLLRDVLALVQERRELPNGYGFRLPASALGQVARWVSLESRCCPFFGFELELGSDGGPLWLTVTGAEGVKTFIRTEFGVDG